EHDDPNRPRDAPPQRSLRAALAICLTLCIISERRRMRQRGSDVAVDTTPPPLDPDVRARVHAWLRRHGRPAEGLHPLTERRYAARYRAYRTELGAAGAGAGVFVAATAWQLVTGERPGTAATLAWFVAAYLILAGGSLLGRRRQRLADRAIAATVSPRVARPVAV